MTFKNAERCSQFFIRTARVSTANTRQKIEKNIPKQEKRHTLAPYNFRDILRRDYKPKIVTKITCIPS